MLALYGKITKSEPGYRKRPWNVWRVLSIVLLALCGASGAVAQPVQSPNIVSPEPTFRWMIPETPAIPTPQADAPRQGAEGRIAPSAATALTTSADPEIAALARALRNDPDLIYEYVYNNVETVPMFGSAKGALGTLLDGRGTAFDQAELMVALLRAAGFAPAVEVGDVTFTAVELSTWLGASSAGFGIEAILQVGGFPCPVAATPCSTLVTYDGNGNVVSARLRWAWIRLDFDGGSFAFNPASKGAYEVVPGIVGSLPGLMGYTPATFLSRALAGSDTSQNWRISGLNRTNIRGDLAAFTANLRAGLRVQQPNAGPIDILGGARVVSLPLNTRLRQTAVPGIVAGTVVTYISGEFPDALAASITVTLPGAAAVTRRSSQVYGRRLSVFFDASRQPVLRLDGVVLATGLVQLDRQSTGINISLTYPGNVGNEARQVLVTAGANAAYLIGTSWAGSGRGMIERQRRILQENRLANPNVEAEPVLGQSLSVLSFNWLAAVTRTHRLSDQLAGTRTLYRHGVGIAGMTVPSAPPAPQITGPYVDLPFNSVTPVQRTARPFAGGPTPTEESAFFVATGLISVLENGVIEQTQPGQVAVSTVKLLDLWSQQGPIVDINNGAVPGNNQAFYTSTIRPTLTAGYSAGDLTAVDNAVNVQNLRVITPSALPAPPTGPGIVVNNWRGIGYYSVSQDRRSIGAIISGQLSGGFSTINLPPSAFNEQTTVTAPPPAAAPTISVPTVSGGDSYRWAGLAGDPLNRVTGDYVYSQDDISVGSGAFPYSLGFARSYDSGRSNASPGPLGRGWTHNLDIAVQPDSDGFEGMAETSPRSGAAAIAAILVLNDLLNAPAPNSKPLDRMVIAAIATRWLMDQLTGNVVRVLQPGLSESFMRTAGDTFAAPGVLLAPNGSSSALTRNADGTYTLITGDGTVMAFGAANLSSPGRVTSWTNAAGAGATFAYAGGVLTSVTNPVTGRSLQLTYTGGRLASVSDGTGRTVSYLYDAANRLVTARDPLGSDTRFEYEGTTGRLTRIFYPAFPTTAFLTNSYDAFGRVFEQRDAVNNLTQAFFAGRRTELLEPSGNRQVWYFNPLGLPLAEVRDFGRNADGSLRLNLTTRHAYDGQSRLASTKLPEGNRTDTTYDVWSNPLTVTTVPKSGSGLTNLTRSFTYVSPVPARPNFRRVASATDPRGNVTSHEYDVEGSLAAINQPAVSRPGQPAPVVPRTTFTYTPIGYLLSTTDPGGRTTAYEYDGAGNRTAMVVDSGAGRLNLRTNVGYDAVGNATSIVPPRGNIAGANPEAFRVRQVFDVKRRLLQVWQSATNLNTITTYDADDRPTRVEHFAWDGVRRPTALRTMTTYTPTGQRSVVTDPSGNTITYAYDGADRLLNATSSSGRQIRYEYDVLSRLVAVREDVSGPLDPSITLNRGNVLRETRAYTPNSLLGAQTSFRTPGAGDTLAYTYDGFDRLSRTTYPLVGAPPARFEDYGYDANDNRTLHRTRAGQDIVLAYDALNRMLTRAVPANANAPAVTYTTGYDLVGRVLRLRQSTDAADVIYAYDTAGRMTGETRPDGRVIGYGRDADGNVTGLIWPTEAGDGYQVTYAYDALGRVTGIFEGAGTAGLRLGGYAYDTASRRLSLDRGNATRTSWGWRPDGLVQDLTHAFTGGASVGFTHLYNREGALSARTVSDAGWQAVPAVQASTSYLANPLNQYTTVGAAALSYDTNGNLTGDGTATYRYDAQNRLVGATVGAAVVSYGYDAEGRRATRVAGATTTRFLYAMGMEIAEYGGAAPGTLLARHVPGAGLDEPLAVVTGTAAARTRLWYHADAQGSVIARSGSGGAMPGAAERFTYTPYGVAGAGSGTATAFRWVGRRLDPLTGHYDMRARVYAPGLGRFVQPDPIGTEGGINLYAYVRNDPLNRTDPWGLSPVERGSSAFEIGPSGQSTTDPNVLLAQGDRGPVSPRALQNLGEATRPVAQAPVSRPLQPSDLGIPAGNLQQLQGTLSVQGGNATVRIDMLQGLVPSPFAVIQNLSNVARAQGASTLTIDATLANPRLLEILISRYGARTVAGGERIVIPLR